MAKAKKRARRRIGESRTQPAVRPQKGKRSSGRMRKKGKTHRAKSER